MLGDVELVEGDKVIMFYNSANRDEDVFDDPFTFDVRRNPNPHIGFGAAGPHFCLGAHLARQEIEVMFRRLFERLPDIESRGRAGPAPLALHQRDQAPRLPLHAGASRAVVRRPRRINSARRYRSVRLAVTPNSMERRQSPRPPHGARTAVHRDGHADHLGDLLGAWHHAGRRPGRARRCTRRTPG